MTRAERIEHNYELQDRPDKAAWERVPQENPLCLDIQRAKRAVGYVLQGKQPLANLCGAPGVGKSFLIREAMQETGVVPIIRKPANYRDLLDVFREAKGITPIVLEEADHLLKSPRCINILKIAADLDGHRYEVVREKHDGDWCNVKYDLSAPLIIATNTNMSLPDRDTKIEEHLSAIRSRSRPIWINSSREIMFEYTCYLAIIHRSIASIKIPNKDGIEINAPVSTKTQDQALEWFMSQLYRLEDASPRTLRRIRDMIYMNPNSPAIWQDDLHTEIFHPQERTFRLAYPPKVFAPPPKLKKAKLAAMLFLLCDGHGQSASEIAATLRAEKSSVLESLASNKCFWTERGRWFADGVSEDSDEQEQLDRLYNLGADELHKVRSLG